MDFKKLSLLIFSLLAMSCGPKNNQPEGFSFSNRNLNEVPRQSFIVRTNNQNHQVEYATADFSPTTSPQELQQVPAQIQQWQPVQQNQMINQLNGFPQAQDRSMYFMQNTAAYNSYSQYPYYGGYNGYPYYHNYYPNTLPSCGYYPCQGYYPPTCGYPCYGYVPTYYYNYNWYYYYPAYAYYYGPYNYFYYSYWW